MVLIGDEYVNLTRRCTLLRTEQNSKLIQQSQHFTPASACIGLKFCFDTQNFDQSYQITLNATLLFDSLVGYSNERCFVLDNQLNGKKTNIVNRTIIVKKKSEPVCSEQFIILMKVCGLF